MNGVRPLAIVVALAGMLAVATVGCGSSATSKADFTEGLTAVLAPGAKHEVLAADYVDCIYHGLSGADREAIAEAAPSAQSTKVGDAVTVRTIRRGAHCDRGETEQLMSDSTADTSESLQLTSSQQSCVAKTTVSTIAAVDDRKHPETTNAVRDGLNTALAHCVSLRDFLERSFEQSNTTTDPACMADYAAKHLSWAQVLEGSKQTLQPVVDTATLLCVNVHQR